MSAGRHVFATVPFTKLIGVQREFSEAGRSRFVLDPKPELENMVGSAHDGVLATLLDVAMASAAVSRRDFQMTAVTLDMHCQFLRPGHGRLIADGEVLAVEADTAMCRASVSDADGVVLAQSHGSFRYVAPR
jgi:uncharacterized protein (TIGR00369 family)